MKKFKIGDWVTVKKSLKPDEYYEGVYFNPKMTIYRGKTFKIWDTDDSESISLEGCLHKYGHWSFSPEMLKPALKPEIKAAFKALKKLAKRVKPVGKLKLSRPPYHVSSDYYYYVICAGLLGRIAIAPSITRTLLSFETLKKAKKFRRKHTDLLEIAKPLL